MNNHHFRDIKSLDAKRKSTQIKMQLSWNGHEWDLILDLVAK
jgi:hypothetical protein